MKHRVGARVIVLDDQQRVLLIAGKQERYWTAPGGHVQDGETLAECAVRETQEETGLRIAVDRLIYLQEFIGTLHPGERFVEMVFLARPIGGHLREGDTGGGGVRRPRWYTREEVRALAQVFPRELRGSFWETVVLGIFPDPYLGPRD